MSARLVTSIGMGFVISLVVACGGRGVVSPDGSGPDTVYVVPIFVEAVDSNFCCAQIGDNGGSPHDWYLEGVRKDAYLNDWSFPGDTVTVHVQSRYYEAVAIPFVIPDTVSRDTFSISRSRVYDVIVPVTRIVPAVLHAQWAADSSGPTIQLEIYAPRGMKSTRITSTSVFFQACRDGDPYCDDHYQFLADGPTWEPDPADTATRRWVMLQGTWHGWPSGLPPEGYNGGIAWQAVLSIGIADDHGHEGHGGCDDALVPSAQVTLHCDFLFQR